MIGHLQDVLPLVASGWRHTPVLVIGDAMLDQYVWGEVDRISPEAPVPVVRALLRDEKPGGAANVAANLAELGASVTLIGFAGGDREQAALETLLSNYGVEPELIALSQTPTTTKLRIISGHQQMMRLDTEARIPPSEDDYRRLLNSALTSLERCSVVVLSDYAKGVLSEAVCQSVICEARRRKIPVLVDPKHHSFARYRGATAICPNGRELAVAAGEPLSDLSALLNAGQELLRSLDLRFMAVTLGENGIALLRPGGQVHAPAAVRQVFDVSGAGDTVIAVMALALACNVPAEMAVQVANLAAGVVVSKVGTVPIKREELLGVLSEQLPVSMQEKVLAPDELVSRVASWRAKGQKIVFTNGCFDLVHIGHIRLLEEARRKGDRLIVALNSDASVRQLKGPLRPIVSEHERAQVLAALSAVDAVVIFEETTPLRLIETLRPDVLVKGGDYTREMVLGAREVEAWGGRVELIPLVKGASTTRLIAAAAPPGLAATKPFSA